MDNRVATPAEGMHEAALYNPESLRSDFVNLVEDFAHYDGNGKDVTEPVDIDLVLDEEVSLRVRLIRDRQTGEISLLRDDADDEERRRWAAITDNSVTLDNSEIIDDEVGRHRLRHVIDALRSALHQQAVNLANSQTITTLIDTESIEIAKKNLRQEINDRRRQLRILEKVGTAANQIKAPGPLSYELIGYMTESLEAGYFPVEAPSLADAIAYAANSNALTQFAVTEIRLNWMGISRRIDVKYWQPLYREQVNQSSPESRSDDQVQRFLETKPAQSTN